MTVLRIYKLNDPPNQVGVPRAFKWAVSRDGAFVEAFRTNADAKAYLTKQGACTLCGEVYDDLCACERACKQGLP